MNLVTFYFCCLRKPLFDSHLAPFSFWEVGSQRPPVTLAKADASVGPACQRTVSHGVLDDADQLVPQGHLPQTEGCSHGGFR